MKTVHLSILVILISGITLIASVNALGVTNNTIISSQNSPITISGKNGEIKFEKNCDLKEVFVINGTIKMPLTRSPVQIKIYYPNGTVYDSERIPPQDVSSDGNYWYTFSLIYSNSTTSGPYHVVVSYSGQSAKTDVYLVLPPIIRYVPDTLRIVDSKGDNLSEINVDQQVQIMDTVPPICGGPKLAYIMQVQDQNQMTVSLSWIEGIFEQGQSVNFSESWTPFDSGNYTITRYLWQSIDNANALGSPISKTIEVK